MKDQNNVYEGGGETDRPCLAAEKSPSPPAIEAEMIEIKMPKLNSETTSEL